MNNAKLYVGNVPFGATPDDLRQHFSQYGEVEEVFLPTDKTTGRPRGFAFVTMASVEAARTAREQGHGATFMGRRLAVAEARPQAAQAVDDRAEMEPEIPEERTKRPSRRSDPTPPRQAAGNVLPTLGESVDAKDQLPEMPTWRETFHWLMNPRQAIDQHAQRLMVGRFAFLIGVALLAVTIPMMISAPSVTPVLGFISGMGAACAALGRARWPWLAIGRKHEAEESTLPPFREMPEQAPALPAPSKRQVIDVDAVEVREQQARLQQPTLPAKPDMPALLAPKQNPNSRGRGR